MVKGKYRIRLTSSSLTTTISGTEVNETHVDVLIEKFKNMKNVMLSYIGEDNIKNYMFEIRITAQKQIKNRKNETVCLD